MVETLPRNVQLKLDQTLKQWRRWQCDTKMLQAPRVVATLGGGISNYSFLVEGSDRFVVRIDAARENRNGLSRSCEWRALHYAHNERLMILN